MCVWAPPPAKFGRKSYVRFAKPIAWQTGEVVKIAEQYSAFWAIIARRSGRRRGWTDTHLSNQFCYATAMDQTARLSPLDVEAARKRRIAAIRLQEIEGNPLSAEDVAMFEMFEREAWPHERRRAYILAHAVPLAAE